MRVNLPGTSKEQAQHSEGNMVEITEDKLFLENDRRDVPEAGRVLPGIGGTAARRRGGKIG